MRAAPGGAARRPLRAALARVVVISSTCDHQRVAEFYHSRAIIGLPEKSAFFPWVWHEKLASSKTFVIEGGALYCKLYCSSAGSKQASKPAPSPPTGRCASRLPPVSFYRYPPCQCPGD